MRAAAEVLLRLAERGEQSRDVELLNRHRVAYGTSIDFCRSTWLLTGRKLINVTYRAGQA